MTLAPTLTLKQGKSVKKCQNKIFGIWPTTLTYNRSLPKVEVDPHIKNQDETVRRESTEKKSKQTDKRMDTTKCISPCFTKVPRSIITHILN